LLKYHQLQITYRKTSVMTKNPGFRHLVRPSGQDLRGEGILNLKVNRLASKYLIIITLHDQALSELGRFGEIELSDLHGGDDHVHGRLAAGTDGDAHGFDIPQHVNQALVETEIPYSALHLAILHQERAVARHSGENLLVGVYFTDVPQAGNQNSAFGRG